jgi:transcriptional regulator with XRE-family HTH domain
MVNTRREADTPEDLSDYLRRILQEKSLTGKDVERRSGGAISQSYVSQILNRGAGFLTTEKIKALADGLGVDPLEVFAVAAGLPEVDRQRAQERQADALFYGIPGVESLSQEAQKELKTAFKVMEQAVEMYKRQEDKKKKG